jgi:hypothetical protein
LSICTIDSEEWHRDARYKLEADGDDLPDLTPDSDNDSDGGELEEGD